MRVCSLLLLALLAVLAGNNVSDAETKPAVTNGQLTGQVTSDDAGLLSRAKRQSRGRGRRPNRPQRPPPPPVTTTTTTTTTTPPPPPTTTEAVTTKAATTAAETTKAATTAAETTAEATTAAETTAEATTAAATTAAAPEPTTEVLPEAPTTAAVPEEPTTGAVPEAPTTTPDEGSDSGSAEEFCGDDVYRSASGHCNNAVNQEWGATDRAFQRLLDPEYEVINNGGKVVHAPRRYSEVDGGELPNVRLISRVVHDPDDRPSRRTVMAMQWGQFLDHDVTATPINPSNKTCCSLDLILNDAQHSDVIVNGPCFPIIIPEDDGHFTNVENRCMENKRSYQTTVGDVPEQINLLSAFVDGSQVYGTSEEETKNLRSDDNGKGRLLDKDGNLPEAESDRCVIDSGSEGVDYCLLAGDHRVNVYPGLGAMHTVFMRMHNVLADGLAAEHPDWDDEKVFQEARRINVAVLQKISYSDWLRVIVGNDAMTEYGLSSGNYGYDDSFDPSLYNVFSAAAFRFGHSMVTDGLVIKDVLHESIDLFNNPHHVLHSLDSLIDGLTMDVSQRVDRWYSTGMTNHMFETSSFTGFDIVSLNIQRGRDHGLAPYYKWRAYCDRDEGAITSFDDLGRGGGRFARVYRNIRDVDLYSGALEEVPVTGGSVGKTYACLIGLQFEALKYGDRFWYENPSSPHPFSDGQIREVERQSLATVICQTTGITSIQRDVFNEVSDNNPLIDCSSVRTVDYSLF